MSGTRPRIAAGAEVRVVAPSRLHCGLFRLHHTIDRQYGGVGIMLDRPNLEVRLRRSEQMRVVGPFQRAVGEWTRRALDAWSVPAGFACQIEVRTGYRRHTGLGLGTQLALAVVSGLNTLCRRCDLTASELAALADRAQRSAIGTHGFLRGGLLIEEGKQGGDQLGRLVARVALPPPWRFVLACPENQVGLSGEAEARAMQRLPQVPEHVSRQLYDLAMRHLRPAAEAGHFEAFSEALYAYGILAGNCFAQVQGGPFATPELQELVSSIRRLGVRGVGQSSWGPTIFALVACADDATRLVAALKRRYARHSIGYTIAEPNSRGACIRWVGDTEPHTDDRRRVP